MDSIKFIVKSDCDSLRIVEYFDVGMWTCLGTTLIIITVLILLTIIAVKCISCCHERKMFFEAHPRVIIKKVYCNKKCNNCNSTNPTTPSMDNSQMDKNGTDKTNESDDSDKHQ